VLGFRNSKPIDIIICVTVDAWFFELIPVA